MNRDKDSKIPRSLYAAMTLQFAVGGAVLPFVTMLLRDRGLEFSRISQVLFASSSTLLVFPFVWGMLADRVLPINRLFTLLNVAGAGALAVFTAQKSFAGLLLSFTVFYACFQPTLILMSALSFHHLSNPKEQFANLRAWGSLGWIIPSLPIYLWLLLSRSSGLEFVLYLGMGISLAMALIALLLPHTPPGAADSRVESVPRLGYWPAVKRLMRNSNYLLVLFSFFLVSGSFSLGMFYSPPLLEDAGLHRAWIGPIQCIGVGFEIVLFRFFSVVMKRWNYAATILLGSLCLVLRHLIYAVSDNPWLLTGSYLLVGMVIVFFHIAASILVDALASAEVRATAQTLLVFFGSGMGPMFANGIAGKLSAQAGDSLRPVFLFASGLAAVASLVILLRGRRLNELSCAKTTSEYPKSRL